MDAQSEEDRKARCMQQQVSELEALVCIACSRGVEPGRCREVIEDAVRRARRKGAMLPHLDSSLLLSTLEQAKGEIAGLTDVTATNAEVMQQELLHHQERAEERAAMGSSEELGAASVQSLPSSGAPPGEAGRPPRRAPGSPAAPAGHLLDDLSSRCSGSAAPSLSGADSGGSAPGVARMPSALSAADIVSPMRDFASEVAAESAVEADEERTFRHSFGPLRPSRAEELRTAAEYDFETALSPRASYHTRDDPFACSFGPLHGGDWLRSSEGLLGLEGSAEGSVPRGVAGEAREAEGLQEEEEGEEPLMFSREAAEEEEEQGEAAAGGAACLLPPVAPHTPSTRLAPPRTCPVPAGAAAGSSAACCSGIPPGFNPAAIIEGSPSGSAEDYPTIDPQSPTGAEILQAAVRRAPCAESPPACNQAAHTTASHCGSRCCAPAIMPCAADGCKQGGFWRCR